MVNNNIDVSCIILSTANDLFVKKRLIPSIIKNSKSHSIEIIVVDNSIAQDFELDTVKVIKTEPYHIPIGYNKGVSEAVGKYIALFHDDCELLDSEWIDKLIGELDDDIVLVGIEEHTHPNGTKYLKEVPTVMEREFFLEIFLKIIN